MVDVIVLYDKIPVCYNLSFSIVLYDLLFYSEKKEDPERYVILYFYLL